MTKKIVYVVHSIDTEGPLYESLEATFERIRGVFGFDLDPTPANLEKLQNKDFDLGGKEEQVAKMLSPELLNYNDNYGKVKTMLDHIGSNEFRTQLRDSFGRGWIYNWHCVDHIGYDYNPRKKDMGYHNIFDYYNAYIKQTGALDKIHWHFHPIHWSKASHISATKYLGENRFFDIIARRILERDWFPSVNRAGFHTERPDSHWLLEQWMPFDLSNQSMENGSEQDDLSGGRFGDWRRAPNQWQVYNPSHDDYQVPGHCRRHIGRCLNIGTRLRLLNQDEVDKAFDEANSTGKALMGFTNHDFRDISPDVEKVRSMLQKSNEKYPEVSFMYCDAREAFNLYLWDEYEEPTNNILSYNLINEGNESQVKLQIKAKEPTFGPQPFLALKTKEGFVLHDNFDFQEPFYHWTYVFDYQTVQWDQLSLIGIGTNDQKGFPHIIKIDPGKEVVN